MEDIEVERGELWGIDWRAGDLDGVFLLRWLHVLLMYWIDVCSVYLSFSV